MSGRRVDVDGKGSFLLLYMENADGTFTIVANTLTGEYKRHETYKQDKRTLKLGSRGDVSGTVTEVIDTTKKEDIDAAFLALTKDHFKGVLGKGFESDDKKIRGALVEAKSPNGTTVPLWNLIEGTLKEGEKATILIVSDATGNLILSIDADLTSGETMLVEVEEGVLKLALIGSYNNLVIEEGADLTLVALASTLIKQEGTRFLFLDGKVLAVEGDVSLPNNYDADGNPTGRGFVRMSPDGSLKDKGDKATITYFSLGGDLLGSDELRVVDVKLDGSGRISYKEIKGKRTVLFGSGRIAIMTIEDRIYHTYNADGSCTIMTERYMGGTTNSTALAYDNRYANNTRTTDEFDSAGRLVSRTVVGNLIDKSHIEIRYGEDGTTRLVINWSDRGASRLGKFDASLGGWKVIEEGTTVGNGTYYTKRTAQGGWYKKLNKDTGLMEIKAKGWSYTEGVWEDFKHAVSTGDVMAILYYSNPIVRGFQGAKHWASTITEDPGTLKGIGIKLGKMVTNFVVGVIDIVTGLVQAAFGSFAVLYDLCYNAYQLLSGKGNYDWSGTKFFVRGLGRVIGGLVGGTYGVIKTAFRDTYWLGVKAAIGKKLEAQRMSLEGAENTIRTFASIGASLGVTIGFIVANALGALIGFVAGAIIGALLGVVATIAQYFNRKADNVFGTGFLSYEVTSGHVVMNQLAQEGGFRYHMANIFAVLIRGASLGIAGDAFKVHSDHWLATKVMGDYTWGDIFELVISTVVSIVVLSGLGRVGSELTKRVMDIGANMTRTSSAAARFAKGLEKFGTIVGKTAAKGQEAARTLLGFLTVEGAVKGFLASAIMMGKAGAFLSVTGRLLQFAWIALARANVPIYFVKWRIGTLGGNLDINNAKELIAFFMENTPAGIYRSLLVGLTSFGERSFLEGMSETTLNNPEFIFAFMILGPFIPIIWNRFKLLAGKLFGKAGITVTEALQKPGIGGIWEEGIKEPVLIAGNGCAGIICRIPCRILRFRRWC